MIDINLLPVKSILSQKDRLARGYLVKAAIGLGIISVLTVGFLTLLEAYFSSAGRTMAAKKAGLMAEFKQQEQTAINLRLVKDKLMGIAAIKRSETQFSPIIMDLISLAGSDFRLTKAFIASDRQVTLSGITANVTAMEMIINRLTAAREEKKYRDITISGLRETPSELSFSISLKYEEQSSN